MIQKQVVTTALALGVMVGVSPSIARADIPEFATELEFCGAHAVWDVTGHFEETFDSSSRSNVQADIILDLSTNGKGKISGRGSHHEQEGSLLQFGDVFFDLMNVPIEGKIKAKDGITKLKFSGGGTGTSGAVGLGVRSFFSEISFDGSVNQTGRAVGTWSVSPCVLVCSENVSIDLGNDGAWTLFLDIATPDGKALEGDAEVDFGSGRTLEAPITKGKYSSDNDRSKIKVKGEEFSSAYGIKVKLKNLAANAALDTITGGEVKYKLLGQKGELSLSNACP
jgi:hypothetical protein